LSFQKDSSWASQTYTVGVMCGNKLLELQLHIVILCVLFLSFSC